VCLQYFDTVGWVLRPVKNRRPYNLYCVGGDVKPCSINQSITFTLVLVLQGNVATKLSYGGKFFIIVMSHYFLIPTLKEF